MGVEALEDRRGQHHLPAQAVARHEIAPEEQIEQLIGSPELDVALEGDRVVGLQERVEELVDVDGPVLGVAQGEVVSLEHARDGALGHQLHHVARAERVEPLAVGAHLGDGAVEDLEALVRVRDGRLGHVLAGEPRARVVGAGGIADHGGEVADHEDDRVPEHLEVAQLLEQHRVPEVQIGAGRIEARLHPQRHAARARGFEPLLELLHHVQVDHPSREEGHLLGDGSEAAHELLPST